MIRTLILLLVITGLSACETVQPWERDILARADMQWEPDGREAVLRQHVFTSKEASSGGGGAAGGGCGCN